MKKKYITNREKYKEILLDIIEKRDDIALKNGVPVPCFDTECSDCDLRDESCICNKSGYFQKWMQSEYKEPKIDWTNVPVDTKILVRNNNSDVWVKRHFAEYKDGMVFAFLDGMTSFTSEEKECNLSFWEHAKLVEDNNE